MQSRCCPSHPARSVIHSTPGRTAGSSRREERRRGVRRRAENESSSVGIPFDTGHGRPCRRGGCSDGRHSSSGRLPRFRARSHSAKLRGPPSDLGSVRAGPSAASRNVVDQPAGAHGPLVRKSDDSWVWSLLASGTQSQCPNHLQPTPQRTGVPLDGGGAGRRGSSGAGRCRCSSRGTRREEAARRSQEAPSLGENRRARSISRRPSTVPTLHAPVTVRSVVGTSRDLMGRAGRDG